jgi:hypothetical protein
VGTAGLAVVTRDAVVLLVDSRYQTAVEMLQASPRRARARRAAGAGQLRRRAGRVLGSLGVRAVGFESAHQRGPPRRWERRAADAGWR